MQKAFPQWYILQELVMDFVAVAKSSFAACHSSEVAM
jgi:hypothetical protein